LNKQEIRVNFKEKLEALSIHEKNLASQKACEKLFNLFSNADCIASFFPIRNEIDIHSFNIQLLNLGSLALPVTFENQIKFYKVTNFNTELLGSSFGIFEPDIALCVEASPDELDAIILPGLSFDREGYRLGYGRGCYDRYLSDHPKIKTIGVAYSIQKYQKLLPREPHDQKVNEVFFF
jgi:5-formyltetrahydrofolate cyclo-ligase